MARIHPTAIIHPDAELGDDVTVGPYSIVDQDVKIGNRVEIGNHVAILEYTEVGDDCLLYSSCVVGGIPQDKKFTGAKSYVKIGARNTLREFVTVNRATEEGGATTVGDGNLLMAYVHLAHNCEIANNTILANAANLAGHVKVDDHAIVGGLVPVHQFVHIGEYSFIGGGFRVPKDVPPYVKAAGEPLRPCGLNSEGLKRHGFRSEVIIQLKKAYRILFRSNLNVSEAIDRIEAELPPSAEIEELVRFVRDSQRGIIC